jgi:hypothetical protein
LIACPLCILSKHVHTFLFCPCTGIRQIQGIDRMFFCLSEFYQLNRRTASSHSLHLHP